MKRFFYPNKLLWYCSVQLSLEVERNLENLLQLFLDSVSVNQETFRKKEKNDKICISSRDREDIKHICCNK